MVSIAKDCLVRRWGARRVPGVVGVLGLLLGLAGGCRGYRPCSGDGECEAGDRCIERPAESGGGKFCGHARGADGGTDAGTSTPCTKLTPMGMVSGTASFGRQVFLGVLDGQLRLVVGGTREVRLYDVQPSEPATFDEVTGLTALGGTTEPNSVAFADGTILRVLSKTAGVTISVCKWVSGQWQCSSNGAASIQYVGDVTPAINRTAGLIGAADGAGAQDFYNVENNLAVKACRTGFTVVGTAFGASSERIAVAVPGSAGSVMDQAVQVAEASDCVFRSLALPGTALMAKVVAGAVATQGAWLVVGSKGRAAGSSEILMYRATTGVNGPFAGPELIPVCSATGCGQQEVTGLALDGDLLAVGLSGYGAKKGTVEVLRHDASSGWGITAAPLFGSGTGRFGAAVAVAGAYVAVGAPDAGTVSLYRCE